LAVGTGPAAVAAARRDTRLVGVTVDSVAHLRPVLAAIRRLGVPITTRLVLDVDARRPASTAGYLRPARRLARVSTVMGELVDSSALRRITVRQVARRARAFVRALKGVVSIWEIGNEVNGDWTGRPALVARKVRADYRVVSAAGAATALTLYYNVGCGDGPGELGPLAWSRRYLGARIRNGLDYVLLSYYEPQCRHRRPTRTQWTAYFRRLHRLFPDAKLGFGEIGLPHPATVQTRAAARSIVRYYYRLPIALPYYVGGCFYWYFAEDMTPWSGAPLWRVLYRAVRGR
jgi:hypothetical protein